MSAVVGNGVSERHVRNYLNNEVINKHKFEVARNCKQFSAGTLVRVLLVMKQDNHYTASIVDDNNVCDIVPISKLYKPYIGGRVGRPPNHRELALITSLNQQIVIARDSHATIPLHINGKTYFVAGCQKVEDLNKEKRMAKADFFLHDDLGRPVYWISHKAGPRPTDFFGYGGLTDATHMPTVKEFCDRLLNWIDPLVGHPGKKTYAMKLDGRRAIHQDIIKYSMFGGFDYAPNHFCNTNVNAIFYGNINLVKNKHWSLQAEKITYNDKSFKFRNYPTIITATYSSDRHNLGFKNTFIRVQPMGCRSIHQWI